MNWIFTKLGGRTVLWPRKHHFNFGEYLDKGADIEYLFLNNLFCLPVGVFDIFTDLPKESLMDIYRTDFYECVGFGAA